MAKVGTWLRGAKGKLAGNVLFKGENATIIRENVIPKNSQTTKQMLQRVAFATVSQAAKYMLPIVGQSFQGANNEKENRRAFVRENVNRLRNLYAAHVSQITGRERGVDISAAVAKGVSVVVPNPYIMSRGSLIMPDLFSLRTNTLNPEHPIEAAGQSNSLPLSIGETYSPAYILGLVGLSIGQQLTLCLLCGNSLSPFAYTSDNGSFNRYSHFMAARIVFNDDEDWAAEHSIQVTAETNIEDIRDAIKTIIDMDKSDPSFVEHFLESSFNTIVKEGEQVLRVKTIVANNSSLAEQIATEFYQAWNPGQWNLYGISYIISELQGTQWEYSNSEMAIYFSKGAISASNNNYYGLRFEAALPTYVKSTDASSELFLRQGGFINNV